MKSIEERGYEAKSCDWLYCGALYISYWECGMTYVDQACFLDDVTNSDALPCLELVARDNDVIAIALCSHIAHCDVTILANVNVRGTKKPVLHNSSN